jgi:hypothetical protein
VKEKMYISSQVLTKMIFALLIIGVSTGLYTLMPAIAYAFVLYAVVVLMVDYKFFRKPLFYVDLRMLMGFLIYNILFFIHSFFFSVPARLYFVHIVSLGIFLLIYAYSKLITQDIDSKKLYITQSFISLCALTSLAVLLFAQLAEILGYIDPRMLEFDDSSRAYLIRPGGFLNPNVTAAISLILLFVSERCSRNKKIYWFMAPLCLTLIIIFLSQSRAGILALVCYLTYLIFVRRFFSFFVISVTVAIMGLLAYISYQSEFLNLIDKVTSRFSGDESSTTRLFLIEYGIRHFLEEPLLGNGYRYMAGAVGWSAHNEIVENLVNYGIIGCCVIALAMYLLYWPATLSFIFICVMPMFMFTHNFFETTAFQASLGLALAIDRLEKYARSR